jgi:hypothetical protein
VDGEPRARAKLCAAAASSPSLPVGYAEQNSEQGRVSGRSTSNVSTVARLTEGAAAELLRMSCVSVCVTERGSGRSVLHWWRKGTVGERGDVVWWILKR